MHAFGKDKQLLLQQNPHEHLFDLELLLDHDIGDEDDNGDDNRFCPSASLEGLSWSERG